MTAMARANTAILAELRAVNYKIFNVLPELTDMRTEMNDRITGVQNVVDDIMTALGARQAAAAARPTTADLMDAIQALQRRTDGWQWQTGSCNP